MNAQSVKSLPARATNLLRQMGGRSSFLRVVVVAAAIFVVFSVLNPAVFLAPSNLQYIALSTPEIALLSMAISLTMLTGGIDLSVVGIANLSAIVCALVLSGSRGDPLTLSLGVGAAFATALTCGLINGLLIAFVKIPPILATLGTQQLFLGLALIACGGTVIKGLPATFTGFALATLAGIPLSFIVMLLAGSVLALLTAKTTLGFQMRLIGANSTAAIFSGIRVHRVLIQAYVISGALAGVAGLIISSRATGANSQYGLSYVLLGIVVAVMAGVDPDGGYITVVGVVIAALAIQALGAGLVSLNVSSHLINVAQGLLLITMMLLNTRVGPWLETQRSQRVHRNMGKGQAA